MAKEETIKKHAREKLIEEGYVIYTPNNTRYGSGVTRWEGETKRGNDVYNIIDMMAWKEDEILLLQYTDTTNTSTRVKKVKKFLNKHSVEVPEGCRLEVWGYKNRKGFTKVEKIS